MKKCIIKPLLQLGHALTRHFHMSAQLRCSWSWLLAAWIILYLLLLRNRIPSELFWGLFGLFSGVWLSKAFDDRPMFVRSYGDFTYMIENYLFFLKSRRLGDRIFPCLFGVSREKVIVVYPLSIAFIKLFACRPFELTLDGAKVLAHKEIDKQLQKVPATFYLKLSSSEKLYAFPDNDTYNCFQLWMEHKKGHKLEEERIKESKIKSHFLGCVLTSVKLWQDPEVLNRTIEKLKAKSNPSLHPT